MGEKPSFITADGEETSEPTTVKSFQPSFNRPHGKLKKARRLVLEFKSGQGEHAGEVWRIVGANGQELCTHSSWEKRAFHNPWSWRYPQ